MGTSNTCSLHSLSVLLCIALSYLVHGPGEDPRWTMVWMSQQLGYVQKKCVLWLSSIQVPNSTCCDAMTINKCTDVSLEVLK